MILGSILFCLTLAHLTLECQVESVAYQHFGDTRSMLQHNNYVTAQNKIYCAANANLPLPTQNGDSVEPSSSGWRISCFPTSLSPTKRNFSK
ncbi:hypothetical protein E2C01_004603 [Portunus trituberculatus]|uniref:Secreted protein n=1 Tax=Portunus trituberculatus TaxID=210409 RepID=A0A5B7CQ51_PORTR|nr:hypothetical protein [Portunus trituberculatus]